MIGKKPDVNTGLGGASAPGDVKAILGKGSEFEGKLRFEGTVRIDGKFKGEVHSDGILIVGENAEINGDLEVDGAIVSGDVKGNINAKTRVELHTPAKLVGNITTPIIVIQEGVIFDGECRMLKGSGGQKSASPAKPAAEPNK